MTQQTKAQRSASAKKAAATRQRNAGKHASDDAAKAAARAVADVGDAAKSTGRALKSVGKAVANRVT